MKGVITPLPVNAVTEITKYEAEDDDNLCSICCYPIEYLGKVICTKSHPICGTCMVRIKLKYIKRKTKMKNEIKQLEGKSMCPLFICQYLSLYCK